MFDKSFVDNYGRMILSARILLIYLSYSSFIAIYFMIILGF